jgi:hypothetical protein
VTVTGPPDITGETWRPSRAQIARAVPPGSRRARTQREWRDAALAAIADAGFRNQRRIHYEGVARILMRHMDWRDKTTRPGHDRIAAKNRISTDTVARAVAWLAGRGLLGLVSPGSTPMTRPYVLHHHEGNTAAVYVLTIPRKPRRLPDIDPGQNDIADLARSRREPAIAPRAREATSEGEEPDHERNGARSARRPVLPRGGQTVPDQGKRTGGTSPAAVFGAVPQDRGEALAAAAALQEQERLFGRVSARMLRHLARPFFAAGWTPADVAHAVDHEPGGRRYGYTGAVRAPAGWIRARLAAWTGPDGPVASRAQQLAAGRAALAADQAARRAAAAATAAQTGDYAAHGARARAMLTARPRPTTPAGYPAGRPHLGST